MSSNLDRYRNDLDALISEGNSLLHAFSYNYGSDEYEKEAELYLKSLPRFSDAYQGWYSEALVLIKQLLPDRLDDFVRLYEKPKGRKIIDYESYRIEDALQNVVAKIGVISQAKPFSALPHLEQQLAIVSSIKRRFKSSLFDITLLVQADLFDSELEAAHELLKHKFVRAAGAIAGVVLEKHLAQVCQNHNVKISRKHPTIANFNDALKDNAVIDIPQWRSNQHLADIRNCCDHSQSTDPTADQVKDLIDGVAKVTKTLY